jgi:hypothetical protein
MSELVKQKVRTDNDLVDINRQLDLDAELSSDSEDK